MIGGPALPALMPATHSTQTTPNAFDRFVAGRIAVVIALSWGLAEATFFFLVPDILLTAAGCRDLRPVLKTTLAALAGALLGGTVMYVLGHSSPDEARSLLERIPAIDRALINSVETQIVQNGLGAVLLGPIKGIPYKIYAVEWGAGGGGLLPFLLISIPARYVRFLLTAVAARVIAQLIEPWTLHKVQIEMLLLAVFWLGFYGIYFVRFGW
jgi:membrane protein YqaA with SNARE-associated domain